MERLFILRFASGKPEAVFKLIDRALHGSPDLIGIIPFRGSPEGAGICPQVFFRIDINHSPAGRSGAGIVTVADTFGLFSFFVVFPFHFGADTALPHPLTEGGWLKPTPTSPLYRNRNK